MTEVNAGYDTQVVALFGFGDPKFSKTVLPGATHSDMTDWHTEEGMNHQALAKHFAHQAFKAGTRAERNQYKAAAKKHLGFVEKHRKMANYFYNNDPSNKPSIPKPAPSASPAASPAPSASPAASPKPAPQAAPSTPPPTSSSPKSYPQNAPASGPSATPSGPQNLPSTNLSGPAPGPSKAFKFGQKVGKVADNYNSNLVQPTKQISKAAAAMWRAGSPHVRHWFMKKKPTSPMTTAFKRNEPTLPLPPKDIAKMHSQQAAYHQNQASSLPPGDIKSQHVAGANLHRKLAADWIQKAVSKKEATTPTPTPTNTPVKPTAPAKTPAPVNKAPASKPVPKQAPSKAKPVQKAPAPKPKSAPKRATAKPPTTVKPAPKAPVKKAVAKPGTKTVKLASKSKVKAIDPSKL